MAIIVLGTLNAIWLKVHPVVTWCLFTLGLIVFGSTFYFLGMSHGPEVGTWQLAVMLIGVIYWQVLKRKFVIFASGIGIRTMKIFWPSVALMFLQATIEIGTYVIGKVVTHGAY